MKKYLIVLAAAVVALASCKKQEGNAYTKIAFKESAITMTEGATQKLQVLYEPTTLEVPQCEWASSDPAVVKVDQSGNLEALSIGEANVTAKKGELEAVCKVSVKSVYDMLSWNLVLMMYD